VDERGAPHVAPVCYVHEAGCIYTPLDEKPKTVEVRSLARVRNILRRPEVALTVDRYSEDWGRLGWVQVRARAALVEPGAGEHQRAVKALRERYSQYRAMAIDSLPVIRLAPERYVSWGELASDDRADLDLEAALRGRRSVRRYTEEPVERALVDRVLEAGRWAPSPHGRMPWRFAVLSRADARARLADAMASTWREQLELDGQAREIVAKRLEGSRDRLRRAPVVVILCLYLDDLDRYPDADRQAAETTMAVQSLGACAQNMLLAAYSLGLDGGWMCAPLFCPDVVRDTLGLRPGLIPQALLTFGYAAAEPVRRDRLPLEELVELYL
jgi:PPOX class probable F420-dependent enzyme